MLRLGERNLRSIMFESEDEKKWLQLLEAQQYQSMEEYTNRQIVAMNVIARQIADNYISRIHNCKTARAMLNKLDAENKITSSIGLLAACEEYHNLRYRPGNNLVTFIELHEAKAQAYEEAGGVIGDYDRVLKLHKSLPVEYDDALSFYEQKDPNTRSYDIYLYTLIQRLSLIHI